MPKESVVLGAGIFAKMLADFPKAIASKIERGAMRDGANFLKAETERRCPVGPAKELTFNAKGQLGSQRIEGDKINKKLHLKFNFATRALKRSRTRVGYRVIVKNPDAFKRMVQSGPNKGKVYFYPAVVEYGSAKRGIPAHPFMRPALDENKAHLTTLLEEGLRKGITEEAEKINAKTKAAR